MDVHAVVMIASARGRKRTPSDLSPTLLLLVGLSSCSSQESNVPPSNAASSTSSGSQPSATTTESRGSSTTLTTGSYAIPNETWSHPVSDTEGPTATVGPSSPTQEPSGASNHETITSVQSATTLDPALDGGVPADAEAETVATGNSESAPAATTTPEAVGGSEDPSMGGFAAVAKYGVTTTTGGSAGTTVTVSDFDELRLHAESQSIVTIQIEGTISAPTIHEVIRVQSNKTLIGLGSAAKLNKITLSISSWSGVDTCEAEDEGTFVPASNVIIRNLEFLGLDEFPDDSDVDPDAIRVECYSHHVWIDHNTFPYGADGSTDVKRGADMVTLSFNHYVKTAKTALIGHSDDNAAQDAERLNVTFHHNFFDQTETRTPRVRFGYAHVYNNYYDVTNHVFRIGPGGRIYAEGNTVVSTEGKILTEAENEGSLTWTDTNVWDREAYGDIGGEKLDADQSVEPVPYQYSLAVAPTSPPQVGVGNL
jgi:pectate lyase